MSEDRALRNLREDITVAQRRLNAARRDGAASDISFWAKRVNELLDRYPRTDQPMETAQ